VLTYPHGATSQKTAFFIVTAVKTSNLTSYGEIVQKKFSYIICKWWIDIFICIYILPTLQIIFGHCPILRKLNNKAWEKNLYTLLRQPFVSRGNWPDEDLAVTDIEVAHSLTSQLQSLTPHGRANEVDIFKVAATTKLLHPGNAGSSPSSSEWFAAMMLKFKLKKESLQQCKTWYYWATTEFHLSAELRLTCVICTLQYHNSNSIQTHFLCKELLIHSRFPKNVSSPGLPNKIPYSSPSC
jgi:hypothetical protein